LRAAPTLSIAGIAVSPPPAAFLQAACEAETVLQELVVAGVGKARQVADLFSGLGTFALALASKARVLAIDGERPLIEALAEAHRRAQGLKPVTTRVRDLYLDPLSPRELDGFDAVVFDPPRAGAKTQAEAIARSKVKTVVAVSCNPATLARDLRILIDSGYRLARVTPVDQFLFTPHLEAVAVLRR
jgi:23S rRNA (uracil1939-C5)-methyltransferase